MGIRSQLILAACIVNFTLIRSIQSQDGTLYQNLFDSLAKKDTKESEFQRKNLNQEAVKEQHAFNKMKEELYFASHRHGSRSRSHWKQMNFNQDMMVVKRETDNNVTTENYNELNGNPLEKALDAIGYSRWDSLSDDDKKDAFSSLAQKYEAFKLGYSFAILAYKMGAREERYSTGCPAKNKELVNLLQINQTVLNNFAKSVIDLIAYFKEKNPFKDVPTLKIEDFRILDDGGVAQDTIATKAAYHYLVWKCIIQTSTDYDIIALKNNKTSEELDEFCRDMSFIFILSCGPTHLSLESLIYVLKADVLAGLRMAHINITNSITMMVNFLLR